MSINDRCFRSRIVRIRIHDAVPSFQCGTSIRDVVRQFVVKEARCRLRVRHDVCDWYGPEGKQREYDQPEHTWRVERGVAAEGVISLAVLPCPCLWRGRPDGRELWPGKNAGRRHVSLRASGSLIVSVSAESTAFCCCDEHISRPSPPLADLYRGRPSALLNRRQHSNLSWFVSDPARTCR